MAQIFVYHYIISQKEWKRLWRLNDFVEGIGCDLSIDFNLIKIKDIDNNGVAEPIIIYTLDNRCDAVFVSTKLIMYVNGKKIAIRGMSQQYLLPPLPQYIIDKRPKMLAGRDSASYKRIEYGEFNRNSIFIEYASNLWDSMILHENKMYKCELKNLQNIRN